MIRVGFVIEHYDHSWVGGLNYLRTLISSVEEQQDPNVDTVLIFPKKVPRDIVDSFQCSQKITTSILNNNYLYRLVRNFSKWIFGVDWPLEVILRRNNIQILSHSWHVYHSKSIKTIEWIPDFQHVHLPHFFSELEVKRRNSAYKKIALSSSKLIVSSEVARLDAKLIYKNFKITDKIHVLNFVAHPDSLLNRTPLEDLKKKYKFERDYFHLPNQFWSHKNHILVIEALRVLKSKNKDFLVICTGHTEDIKNPNHFFELMQIVNEANLNESFRVLGLVSKSDLYGLMEHSIGVINPSFFEGWSTTVEEAKAMRKKILLSDIPVHREQKPEGGLYFSPNDVSQLVHNLEGAMNNGSTNLNGADDSMHLNSYMNGYKRLGKDYIDIVKELGIVK